MRLPALRERREDIPLLAAYFLERQCRQYGLPQVELRADAGRFLMSLPYPGNIRELKNLVERTLLVCRKDELSADDFRAQYVPAEPVTDSSAPAVPTGMTLDEIERQAILQALERSGRNLSQAAAALGISRGALYRRLDKYGISYTDEG